MEFIKQTEYVKVRFLHCIENVCHFTVTYSYSHTFDSTSETMLPYKLEVQIIMNNSTVQKSTTYQYIMPDSTKISYLEL